MSMAKLVLIVVIWTIARYIFINPNTIFAVTWIAMVLIRRLMTMNESWNQLPVSLIRFVIAWALWKYLSYLFTVLLSLGGFTSSWNTMKSVPRASFYVQISPSRLVWTRFAELVFPLVCPCLWLRTILRLRVTCSKQIDPLEEGLAFTVDKLWVQGDMERLMFRPDASFEVNPRGTFECSGCLLVVTAAALCACEFFVCVLSEANVPWDLEYIRTGFGTNHTNCWLAIGLATLGLRYGCQLAHPATNHWSRQAAPTPTAQIVPRSRYRRST